MTPRERRDWPLITAAVGFLLGFCFMGLLRYLGL
jgi:hypothetical protein